MDKDTTNNAAQDNNFSEIETELQGRFELLSPELKQVITSSDYQMKLFEIAKKYKLTYDILGKLEVETTMVLIGMTPTAEYKDDLREQLGVPDSTLESVVSEINDQIFRPIRTKLMELYPEERGAAEEALKRPAAVPSVAPYTAPVQTANQFLAKNETEVLERSGIEVVEEAAAPRDENAKLLEREMADGITNPPKSSSISLNQIRAQAGVRPAPVSPVSSAPAPVAPAPATPAPVRAPLPPGIVDIPVPMSPSMSANLPKAPQAPASSIVSAKLGAASGAPAQTSNYSVPSMKPIPPSVSGSDPYREPIQ